MDILNRSTDELEVKWIDIQDVYSLEGIGEEDYKILSNWVNRSNQYDQPWFKGEWRHNFEKRVKNVVGSTNVEFKQIRSWERSSLFKLFIGAGDYYFKAVPDVFSHEPLVSDYLNKYHQGLVPTVIYVNPDNNEYIMEELKGGLLGYSNDINHWRDALTNLAAIQKQSINQISELRKMGCPTYSVSQTTQGLLEVSLGELKEVGNFSNNTYSNLISTLSTVYKFCNELETSKIPYALEHGDYFGGNIIVQGDQPIIYDWSDCTISHPFLSATVIVDELEETFSSNIGECLLEEYLSEWNDFDTLENLRYEFNLVKRIAPLYYLTVYQQFIFPHLRDNWDQKQIIDDYVNQWLSTIDEVNE
ncbi:phosphotransferase [Alkalibacillus silvisoli]|uniref:phosphotransferase n=1 Tax=Alkalibacillus silvisoli TaxID=392823 RepID=UPI0031DA82B6